MQTYLFVSGNHVGLSVPVQPDQDTIQLPAGVTGKDNYVRDTLAVGDAAITIYRHESLTSEKVLDLMVEHYKAWSVNRPGGHRPNNSRRLRL